MENFFKMIAKKKGKDEAKDLRRYFDRRKNLFILYGGDLFAANFAFEFILEQNVDTIYWFADFRDRIDADTIKALTKDLRRKGVKTIAHNFLGKSVRDDVKKMVRKTGGQTIEVIPGQG